MNSFQKEVEKQLIKNEKEILNKLKENYTKALVEVKIRIKSMINNELTQSKRYQLNYQKNLEKQLTAIVDLLSNSNINAINDYLVKMYKDGFVGTLYNMQMEGIPFVIPISQNGILEIISKKTSDFKLSKTLYKNANELKEILQTQISRGISQGMSYIKIAQRIALNSEADLRKAYRIARTEGGRVSTEAKYKCMKMAKENGAHILKEWDSTLDSKTRESHSKLDGQMMELEEYFEIDGKKALYPHGFNIAEEDINCRCVLLERAEWAISEQEKFTKIVNGTIKKFNSNSYREFKESYFSFYNI